MNSPLSSALTVCVVLPVMSATTICADDASAPIAATARRKTTQFQLTVKKDAVTLDVTCKFGIDAATLERRAKAWPKSITVKLHLKGLESIAVVTDRAIVQGSISSTGPPVPRLVLRKAGKSTKLDKKSPYWFDIRLVGKQKKIPLKDGHFEFTLPAKLLEGNPRQIVVRWVDFFRG